LGATVKVLLGVAAAVAPATTAWAQAPADDLRPGRRVLADPASGKVETPRPWSFRTARYRIADGYIASPAARSST
jgi:hypothetical protein